MSRVPVYRGHFGAREAERLLWRAGFGPFPGEAEQLALAPAHGAAAGPTRVLVRAEEYHLLLSQLKVNPGDSIVQLFNAGEDSHDLQIQRVGDGEQFSIGELPPGEVSEIALRLRRDSRYVMWCSLPNHRELGMEASLRVRRKRR